MLSRRSLFASLLAAPFLPLLAKLREKKWVVSPAVVKPWADFIAYESSLRGPFDPEPAGTYITITGTVDGEVRRERLLVRPGSAAVFSEVNFDQILDISLETPDSSELPTGVSLYLGSGRSIYKLA